MLAKGQIVGILDNTYRVRIPDFETAAMQTQAILEAQVAIQPGQFNCYYKNDIV